MVWDLDKKPNLAFYMRLEAEKRHKAELGHVTHLPIGSRQFDLLTIPILAWGCSKLNAQEGHALIQSLSISFGSAHLSHTYDSIQIQWNNSRP